MSEKVKKAISQIKKCKSPGPVNLSTEIFKLLDEEGITLLTKVFKIVYI